MTANFMICQASGAFGPSFPLNGVNVPQSCASVILFVGFFVRQSPGITEPCGELVAAQRHPSCRETTTIAVAACGAHRQERLNENGPGPGRFSSRQSARDRACAGTPMQWSMSHLRAFACICVESFLILRTPHAFAGMTRPPAAAKFAALISGHRRTIAAQPIFGALPDAIERNRTFLLSNMAGAIVALSLSTAAPARTGRGIRASELSNPRPRCCYFWAARRNNLPFPPGWDRNSIPAGAWCPGGPPGTSRRTAAID